VTPARAGASGLVALQRLIYTRLMSFRLLLDRDALSRVSLSCFIEGLTQSEYLGDDLRRSAVERQLEIIGAALNNLRRLDADMAASIPEVRRKVMRGGSACRA